MKYYSEEEFYQDSNGPVEHYLYSNYLFYQDSCSKWGQDYDLFVFVENSWLPYIRKIEKRGSTMSPCGGNSSPSADGSFAQKTPEERDEECPKIVFGIAASFLINLKYDKGQDDFVLLKESLNIMREYYNRFRDKYLSTHNGLRYQDVSYEKKELDFIELHIAQENKAWERSCNLNCYPILYKYAERFFEDYLDFIDKKKKQLQNIVSPNRIVYAIQKYSIHEKDYLKVFLKDNSEIQKIQTLLSSLSTIRKVNITLSQNADDSTESLTVYPKEMCNSAEVIKEIRAFLDTYSPNVTFGNLEKDSSAHFAEIEAQILEELGGAQAMIDVCIAWFTNIKIRDKLYEMQQKGIKVRVIIYNDGVNKMHGVDLSAFEHQLIRGEHGGIMHDKFCVIDNVTTITGSYNWTNNAEYKNDENIVVQKNDVEFASKYTRQFNLMWNR